jgi:hypothetical protein
VNKDQRLRLEEILRDVFPDQREDWQLDLLFRGEKIIAPWQMYVDVNELEDPESFRENHELYGKRQSSLQRS